MTLISHRWLLLSLLAIFGITELMADNLKEYPGVSAQLAVQGDMVTSMVTSVPKVTKTNVTYVTSMSPMVSLASQTNQSTPISSADPRSVVINEIAWMGTSDPNDEWIELYNLSTKDVDLTGWTLSAQDGSPLISLSGIIKAERFFLLERGSDEVISDVPADQIYSGALNNSGELLELKSPKGEVVDLVKASSGWFAGDNPAKDPLGRASMERVNPFISGQVSSNWKSNNKTLINGHDKSGQVINGTPRKVNSQQAF